VKPKILAISSAGGHWVQLQRMRTAWDGCEVTFVTTKSDYKADLLRDAEESGQSVPQFFTIIDANRWQKIRLLRQLLGIFLILLRVRPDVVISTGAASGYFAIRIAKVMGARTIWVDSIANAEELPLSGMRIGPYADMWLTQWEHLAKKTSNEVGPDYKGAVI